MSKEKNNSYFQILINIFAQIGRVTIFLTLSFFAIFKHNSKEYRSAKKQILNIFKHTKSLLYVKLSSIGRVAIFLFTILLSLVTKFVSIRELLKQTYVIGSLSLPIIATAGLFVGMVLGLQGYNILVDFNAEEAVGVMTSLSLVRELGPVVGALLFTGRAGSALTAEIGLMKTTEQLAALRMMAVDPIDYCMAPRFLASVISLPMLCAIFVVIGIYGGYFVAVSFLGVDGNSYWGLMQESVQWQDDIMNGIIKSIVFAFFISTIALYQGYESAPSSEGISKATTKTVVYGSLMVLGLDFILTGIMFD